MAKLLAGEYPFPKYDDYGNRRFDDYLVDSQKALDAIPVDKLFYQYVADGNAYYYVVSLTPLVLQHIDYLDGYHLPIPYIRGLRKADVLAFIESTKQLQRIFSKKDA